MKQSFGAEKYLPEDARIRTAERGNEMEISEVAA